MILVDLFSGCGGFSLGAHRAGFSVASAYDIDATLTSSFAVNFPNTKLVLDDVSSISGTGVLAAAGGKVDGIFGGPPCQGFSAIGRRQKDDPRRRLLGHFFRIVSEAEPSFFVMENVRGLEYSDARDVLDEAIALVSDRYNILGPKIWNAADFGAATSRRRLFVIGIHKDVGDALTVADVEAMMRPAATVRAAIADLKDASFVGMADGFDVWRIGKQGRPHAYAKPLRSSDKLFTGQQMTVHTDKVIDRFKSVPQGGIDVVGRHPRLAWDGQCPTLRAGTGSDRGSYQAVRPLHPEEPRVITVREAARLQGFPDTHRFHPTVWHSFRMIGNSVSPIMSEAIFTAIRKKLAVTVDLEIAAE
ncbi:MAG: DNA cytosine methyltransferase [Alphaproteobacteria bacterium]|jgi:DNA (cytosine-5)-methyltransferase 1|nr:DNA cytosine methyltransferase [Alphaproteobacteria bacterium]MBU2379781.1 DNA cytosine methyltransferase [Alphaproteobacteria bacterium]